MKLTQYLVRLYPHHWRSRYEEEFLEMLAQQPISFLDGIDLFLGMLDAHLHPYLGAGSFSERMRLLLSTLRGSLLTIFCAYSGFLVAGLAFQKLTEDGTFAVAARTYSVVGISFQLVLIGAVAALLAVLTGGLPIVVAVIRFALARKHYGPLLLLTVPILAFAAFLGTSLLLKVIDHPGDHLAVFWHLFLLRGTFFGSLIAAAIISTGAVCLAVARSEISVKLLHFAVVPSVLATFSMALILAATVTWGLGLHDGEPHLFSGNNGLVGTSTTGTWLGIVIAMGTATLLATISLQRGISAYSALYPT